jgi:hypothetical protein
MKKILFSAMLSLMAFSAQAQDYLLGDVNRDGKVTVADAMMVVNIIMKGYAPFSVSPTTVTMPVGGTAMVEISGGYNQYEVTSANTAVVEASLEGTAITLTAVASGESKIFVKDILTMRILEILVMVENAYLACPDNYHPHLIDLGLPSGTKWACCNVGATTPEDYGGYYAWGETEEKTTYIENTYQYYQGGNFEIIGSDIAGTQYDVAHVKWGSSWVMPSYDQQNELLENCNYEWTEDVNGINGGKFTSKINGASIFLPAAGFRGKSLYHAGTHGYYWLSTHYLSRSDFAYGFLFASGYANWNYNFNRDCGQSVRPVVRN